MKQTTKRLVSIVMSIVFFVAAFIIFINLIKPEYEAALGVKADVLSRKIFIEGQQAMVQKAQQLINTYGTQAELQQLIALTLPFGRDVSGALAQFAGLVNSETLGSQSFSIAESGAATSQPMPAADSQSVPATTLRKPAGILTLQSSFAASYDGIKSFFEKLESNIRIFNIESFAISPAGKPKQDLYKVDLKVATYFQQT